MNSARDILEEKILDRSASVAILGLGYVGLPLAAIFAEAGFNVIGIEPDSSKVEKLARGESYIQDVESEQLRKLIQSGKLQATTDFSVLAEADAVSICVPTPLRKTTSLWLLG